MKKDNLEVNRKIENNKNKGVFNMNIKRIVSVGCLLVAMLGVMCGCSSGYSEYRLEQRLEKEEKKLAQEETERWEALVNSHPSVVDWKIAWNEDLNAFEVKGEQPTIATMSQKIIVSDINLTNITDKPMVLKNINFAWNGEDYVAGEKSIDKYGYPHVTGEWVFVDKEEFDGYEDLENYPIKTKIISMWVNDSDSFIHEDGTSNIKLEQDLDLVIEPNESITIKMDGATTYFDVTGYSVATGNRVSLFSVSKQEILSMNREIQLVIEEA